MTHFAVFAPPLKGHYGPYSVLAEELTSRGHRVTFVHHEEARQLVECDRAEFAAVGSGSASLDSWTRPMSRIRGIVGLGTTMKRMEEFTTMLCREGPAHLRNLGVEAVISDQLEPAGELVAEHLGLPVISVATTVPMNREDSVPPPFVNWSYRTGSEAERRNAIGWKISDFLMRGFNRCIARNAEALSVPSRKSMEDCFSRTLQLSQLVEGIDFPRRRLPPSFSFVGPFQKTGIDEFTLPRDGGRPTAYCTLGTLQGARAGLFHRIASACSSRKVRLVLTHGGRGDERRMARLPGNPLVYDWLPQREVLSKVDIAVCHGGMVTILDALSAGLPILVIPLAFEQAGIAARVVRSGAGLMLSRRASASAIGNALERLLEDPRFRERSRALASEIAASGGVRRAADLIEQSLAGVARQEAATKQRGGPDDVRDDSRSGSR